MDFVCNNIAVEIQSTVRDTLADFNASILGDRHIGECQNIMNKISRVFS